MDDFYSGLRCTAVSPLQPTGGGRAGPRAPPCAPPFCRRLFLAGDFSRPGEVTAAPGKPIAPSGEPGDKFMPLLNPQSQTRELTLRT